MNAPLTMPRPVPRRLALRFLQPLTDPRTPLKAAHLALMFPLGTAYFVFFVTALAFGGSLIWTFVGPAVLLLAMFVSRWLGDAEAFAVTRVTGLAIKRPPFRLEGVERFRDRVKVRLVDPTTWTGLVYLFVQFPVGVAAFVLLVTFLSIAFALTGAPLIAWLSDEPAIVLEGTPWAMTMDSPLEAAIFVPFGLVALLLSAHLIVALSAAHARWARLMLGSRARSYPRIPGPVSGAPTTLITGTATPVQEPASDAGEDIEADPTAPAWQLPGFRDLTPREREVLMLLASGLSNAEIAETFVVSEGTVKTHVKRVLAKLDVRDRTQAAVLAHQRGLLAVNARLPATFGLSD